MQPFPTPSGDDYVSAEAVDCRSSRACTAVGSAWSSRTMLGAALAESWNGHRWAIQEPPMPSAAIDGDLAGVSCPSANDCTAVGYYIKSRSRTTWPLADRWDGRRWHIESTPVPAGAGDSKFEDTELSAVSCSSRTSCLAVGVSLIKRSRSLAERWDGKRWSIIPPPKGANPSLGLRGVSCISRNDCLAVGGSPALAEWWNGEAGRCSGGPKPCRLRPAQSFWTASRVPLAASVTRSATGTIRTATEAHSWSGGRPGKADVASCRCSRGGLEMMAASIADPLTAPNG